MKYAFFSLLFLSIAGFSGPVEAILADGGMIIGTSQVIPPVVEGQRGDSSAKFMLKVGGLEPIHGFTLPVESIEDVTDFGAVPVVFVARKGKSRVWIFLPAGGDPDGLQDWLLNSRFLPATPTLELDVKTGPGNPGCVIPKESGSVLKCMIGRTSALRALALHAIESASPDPKATFWRLFNARYYDR